MSRARSIALPIFLLALAAVTLATAAQFAITFIGPPPRPAPVLYADVAEALRTGRWRSAERQAQILRGTAPPVGFAGLPSPERDAAVAEALGADPASVHGLYEQPDGRHDGIREGFAVSWTGPEGVRTVRSLPAPLVTSWHRVVLVAALATLLALAAGAWWIARAIARPIARLAAAAKQARLGARTPISCEGPREVRELAEALEDMRVRILEQAEGRTAMLAAIAHDLGTPLARISFLAEQLPDATRMRAHADIDEMRAMLGDVMRFARDIELHSPNERIELGSLVESVATDLAAGGLPVAAEPGERAVVLGDSRALRRLFANLAENAVRYGGGARLRWSSRDGWCEALVDDDGPGFGEDREALFAPFVRGEASRNRATGGAGLGLAIVRGIAEAHGGSVLLENRAEGGGRVRVRLPLAQGR